MKPRILVSLPMYGGQCYDKFLSSFNELLTWGTQTGTTFVLQGISNESLLPRARNLGVAKLLDHRDEFSHILFVDGDMGFSSYRFQRLIEWDQPLVGCPGPVKYIYWDNIYEAVLKGRDLQSFALRYAVNFLNADGFDAVNGYAKVRDLGCCFFLVQTQALVEMSEKYHDLKCHSMSHVNGKAIDSSNCYALFDTCKIDDGRYLECDHAFMHRWRSLGDGHDVWADMTGDLTHAGTYHFAGSMSDYYFGEQLATQVSAYCTRWGSEMPPKEEETAANG
jgi:hypothetical protein